MLQTILCLSRVNCELCFKMLSVYFYVSGKPGPSWRIELLVYQAILATIARKKFVRQDVLKFGPAVINSRLSFGLSAPFSDQNASG